MDHILIIEDDVKIHEVLSLLMEDNYKLQFEISALSGLKSALKSRPDLILLDLNMPEMDGFQVCKLLRMDDELNDTPIIMLTGSTDVLDRTKAFETGADDYISKPFDNSEFLARIKRKLEVQNKRNRNKIVNLNSSILFCGNLQIDLLQSIVKINEKIIQLSKKEFKLLYFLVSNKERLLSREEIIGNVWENQNVSPRLIDPHILSLRSKLKNFNFIIHSLYRGGYILKSFEKI